MRWRLTRMVACAALVVSLEATPLAAALADGGWYGRYGGSHRHHYSHRYRFHHHDDDVAVGILVFLGGLLVGHLLTWSYESSYDPQPIRSAPESREPLRLGDCKPTTGEQVIDGRLALMAGTWCTDQYGRGYILDDSVRFVRYLS